MTFIKYVHNVSNDEVIVEEMTAEEAAERQADIDKWQSEKTATQTKEENLWKTKVEAYEKLGLTADEIEAIAPTPEWLLPKKPELS